MFIEELIALFAEVGSKHMGSLPFNTIRMTMSAPTAALTGRLLLGEHMRPIAVIGMIITVSGIALSILSKSDDSEHRTLHFKFPAKGIAFFDTAMAVNRLKDNASDAFLEIVERTDIRALLAKMPQCKAIATTGEKATVEVCEYFNISEIPAPNSKITLENDLALYRLPSSSRAYPLAFEKKAESYRKMFEEVLSCQQ